MPGPRRRAYDPVDLAVGARVRFRRLQLGVPQAELAKALRVSQQQVQKYERGQDRFAASTLVRAAAALQTTVGHLIGEDRPEISTGNALLLARSGAPELLAEPYLRRRLLAVVLAIRRADDLGSWERLGELGRKPRRHRRVDRAASV
jgi:transcriptional regulator with XRE-family HTH domain